ALAPERRPERLGSPRDRRPSTRRLRLGREVSGSAGARSKTGSLDQAHGNFTSASAHAFPVAVSGTMSRQRVKSSRAPCAFPLFTRTVPRSRHAAWSPLHVESSTLSAFVKDCSADARSPFFSKATPSL